MTIVVAAEPLLPGVAEASLGDQAYRGISASPASREHRRDAPSLPLRRQRGRTPAAVWRAPAAAGPALQDHFRAGSWPKSGRR